MSDGRDTSRPSVAGSPAGGGAASGSGPWAAGFSWMVALGVFLATAFVFWPALDNEFNYDDLANVVHNPHFRGLSGENLAWMFTTFRMGHYQPLTWLSLALNWTIGGEDPASYHALDVLLHSVSAVLVYLLALVVFARLSSDRSARAVRSACFAAAIAALLFALHPLRVEAVAWVTQRRLVLSSVFLLASVLCYLRAVHVGESSRRRWLAGSLVAHVISLLARAGGIVLPVVLLVLDVWPLRRLGGEVGWLGRRARRVWLEKLCYLVPALAVAAVAPLAQQDTGATIDLERHGVIGRIAQACFGIPWYLGKTLWPDGLVPLYELRLPVDPFAPRYLLGFAVTGLLVAAAASFVRRAPAFSVAFALHCLFLAPVLGFVQSGPQEVADRYAYFPAIGWSLLVGGLLAGALARRGGARRQALLVGSALLVVSLGALTWRQCDVWQDHESLWRRAVEAGPPSAVAHVNLASVVAQRGDVEGALFHFREADRIAPGVTDARYRAASALTVLGRYDEAAEAFRAAIELQPDRAEAHARLCAVEMQRRRWFAAEAPCARAAELAPGDADARLDFGRLLARLGRRDEAIRELEAALALRPGDGRILTELRRLR